MINPKSSLVDRYGDEAEHLQDVNGCFQLATMLGRGSYRSFQQKQLDLDLIQLFCAAALASPTKSDLQQRDIIALRDPELKSEIVQLLSGQRWIADAPCLMVFCGNNRRQRCLHERIRRVILL